ncbi:thiamine pyrophosphate-dependent dehydrogenase E1 component subunit alpha [Magnetococcales bacterium HHB-1]
MEERDLLELYRIMLLIRRVEEAIALHYAEQKMRCPTHLCLGQEAIAAGVCYGLRQEDQVFSHHRAHGHYLAKGGALNPLIAEMYGKSQGCCQGRGGSMHLQDLEQGFAGAVPIVGGTIPLAVGMAWSFALQKKDLVSVVFFGDGCFEEGVLHESMNFAALKKLPVIFVCENNEYSVFTPRSKRQPQRAIHNIAKAHGLETHYGEGNRAEAVYTISRQAIQQARQRQPQFIELLTHRWLSHVGPKDNDHLNYRKPGELKQWKARCPLKQMENILKKKDLWQDTRMACMLEDIEKKITEAFLFAEKSPPPTTDVLFNDLFAP